MILLRLTLIHAIKTERKITEKSVHREEKYARKTKITLESKKESIFSNLCTSFCYIKYRNLFLN